MADENGSGGRRDRRSRPSGGTLRVGEAGRGARVWRWAFAIAGGLVGAAALAAVGAVVANRQSGESVGESVTTTMTRVLQGGRQENVLLIGNNARHADTPLAPGQADLLYVLHFVPAHHEVVIISIPRDTMVAYPGWQDPIPKIKSALLMGGPGLEMKSVSKLTGMPIDGYIEADFAGFAAAIDAVGGVYLNIPGRVYDPTFSGANFYPGYQHIDGTQALAYVRVRQNQVGNGLRVNSFQRQDAGVEIMDALKKQVLSHESVGELTHLVSVLRRDFATNLSMPHLVGLLAAADRAKLQAIAIGHPRDSMVITTTAVLGVNTTGEITGAYYDILNPAEIERTLAPYGAHHATTGIAPLPPPGAISVDVSDNAMGLQYASLLRRDRCHVTLGAPASSGQVVISYPMGRLPAAEVVGRIIGEGNEIVTPGSSGRTGVILLQTP